MLVEFSFFELPHPTAKTIIITATRAYIENLFNISMTSHKA
jgi:hypothetical protein